MTKRALTALTHEGHDRRHYRLLRISRLDRIEPTRERPRSEEQIPVGAPDHMHRLSGQVSPLHPHHVEPGQIGQRPDRETEWNDVGAHPCDARHHSRASDPGELVCRGEAAYEDEVSNLAMATEHGAIGHDDVATDAAIMTDMAVGHEEAPVANLRDATAVLGAGAHGHRLADLTISANHQTRGSAPIMDRLRRRSQRGERIDDGPRTNCGDAGDMHMSEQPAPLTEPHIATDHTIGTDLDVIGELSASVETGRGMN